MAEKERSRLLLLSCETCPGSVREGLGFTRWNTDGGTGWLGLVATEERTECAVVERGQARGGGFVWIAAWLVGVVVSLGRLGTLLVRSSFPWSSLPPGSPHCCLLSDGDGRPKSGAAFQKELLVSSLT